MSVARPSTAIPRRTFERRDSAQTTTAGRPSRISQLIRRPSLRKSDRRSGSLDNIPNNLGVSLGPFGSVAKKHRSISATPMRTPSRNFSITAPTTVERSHAPIEDKRWLQTQVSRINDYVGMIKELPDDFVARGGVKSISTKQFVTVVAHLLKFVVGNRFTISTNYVDDISKIMVELQYPFNINKSWLKTPNAPHSFNHVVTMIGWLLDFVPSSENNQVFEQEDNLMECPEFPGSTFSQHFIKTVKTGFSMWNNSQDVEFEELQNGLIDDLICRKTHAMNANELANEIKVLAQKLDTMKKKPVIVADENELKDLTAEADTAQTEIDKLTVELEAKAKLINSITSRLDLRRKSIAVQLENIAATKEQIAKQKMTVAERDIILDEIIKLNYLYVTQAQSLQEKHDMGMNIQMAKSRAIKERYDLITKLNNLIFKVSLTVDKGNCEKMNGLMIRIDQDVSAEKLTEAITQIASALEKWKRESQDAYTKLFDEKLEIEHQLKYARMESNFLSDNLAELIEKNKQNSDKIVEIKRKTLIVNKQAMDKIEVKQIDIQKKKSEIRAKEQELVKLQKIIDAENEANAKYFAEQLKLCTDFLDEKAEEINIFRGTIDDLKAVADEFKKSQNTN